MNQMQEISQHLLNWYDTERRHLPWRAAPGTTANSYHVWLSEIMLQQTTVATVKAYFEKFTKLWPTLEALAAAPVEEVLKEWAGLGYYARARNLHKCANVVATEFAGEFPADENTLRKLPGIGDYTAAAIASIAFGQRAVVVDGNIERVVSRLNRIEAFLPQAKKPIKAATDLITPTERAGDFAQAMMDLGAMICTPKSPKCLLCPIQKFCSAAKTGDMEAYPRKKPKKALPTRRAVSFWLMYNGDILLERRPNKGLLGGMPGLFSTPWVERNNFPQPDEWPEHSPTTIEWNLIEDVTTHTFTHFRLETQIVVATVSDKLNIENGFWHPAKSINSVGLPTVFSKMVKLIT